MIAVAIYVVGSALIGALVGVLLGRMFMPPRSATTAQQVEGMRNLLAFLLVAAFISVLPVLTFKAIPKDNEQILTYMLGQLSGMATMALGFYFVNKAGQDAVDAKRVENTGKLADAVTSALKSGPDGTKPDVILEPGETAQAAPETSSG